MDINAIIVCRCKLMYYKIKEQIYNAKFTGSSVYFDVQSLKRTFQEIASFLKMISNLYTLKRKLAYTIFKKLIIMSS
jgi:hypothetical protein